jgi:hypothetical protein
VSVIGLLAVDAAHKNIELNYYYYEEELCYVLKVWFCAVVQFFYIMTLYQL